MSCQQEGIVIIRLTITDNGSARDISSATVKSIRVKSPAGIVKNFGATFTTDGTDGKIEYETSSGDLDETGAWSAQAWVTNASGAKPSSIATFTVKANL